MSIRKGQIGSQSFKKKEKEIQVRLEGHNDKHKFVINNMESLFKQEENFFDKNQNLQVENAENYCLYD